MKPITWHQSFVLACLMLLCAGCTIRNPLPDTVVAAHGNTDWHKDTAQEFLDGKNLAGTPVASNFAPKSWTKRHIHTGMTNTADYYHDKSQVASGKDTDGTNGIDNTMLFFYAGHGYPDGWDTLGNSAASRHRPDAGTGRSTPSGTTIITTITTFQTPLSSASKLTSQK